MQMDRIILPIQLETGYRFVCTQIGHWSHYTVRVIHHVSPYFQNSWITGAALIGLNIICFEASLSICHVIYKTFYKQTQKENIAIHASNERTLSLGMLFVATMGIANWAFCHMVQPSLSNWKIVALSVTTAVGYLVWKTC